MNKSVSVVIPSYKGVEMLQKYLPSVFRSLRNAAVDYEVIVVDDASGDDTRQIITSAYPRILFLENEKNLGFAGTINRGIGIASKDLVLCLNNDMELPVGYIAALLPLFDREDTFGVMSPMKDITGQNWSEGVKHPMKATFGFKMADMFPQKKKEYYTFFLCGGNSLYDRRKLQSLGGFPTLYQPFYYEDVDLSIRAWLAGWKCYCSMLTECYHMHSATIKNAYQQAYIDEVSYRNFLIFSYVYSSDQRSFLRTLYCRLLTYSVVSLVNRGKRMRIKAMISFLKQKQKADLVRQNFEKWCETNKLGNKGIDDIVNLYFSGNQ